MPIKKRSELEKEKLNQGIENIKNEVESLKGRSKDLTEQLNQLTEEQTEIKREVLDELKETYQVPKDGEPGEKGEPGEDGRDIFIRTSNGYIQWRHDGEEWQNLVPLSELKGTKGDPGEPGKPGKDGENGKSVELQKTQTYIQWRQEGGVWRNLIAIDELKEKVVMSGGGGGGAVVVSGVLEVVAGTNITVDNTDPKRPVVSATGGGGGAVDSVNGQTGVVVLDAADVGADPAGSAAQALEDANDYTDQEIALLTFLESVIAGSNISIDNSDPQNPVISATASDDTEYRFQDEELTDTYAYVGYEHLTDGSWYIYRRTRSNNLRQYATGLSDYATAWTDRAGQVYS